jgi:hypothetical protein
MPQSKIEKIVEEKLNRLESVPDAFVSSVEKSQLEAYKEIEKIIMQMDTDNGILLVTDKNTALLASIDKKIKDTVFNDEYTDSLTSYIREYNVQGQLANSYFVELNVGFTDADKINTILASQKNALSVLGEDAFTQSFIAPLNQLLQSSISSNAGLLDTIKSLRTFALGDDEVEGRMVAHVKRVAYDAFAVSDRTYTSAVANSLGLEWYLYRGGKIKDTRQFCLDRVDKYFHKKEIEKWANLEWQGKNSLTNKTTIFTLAGGYNCKHNPDPVSIKSVPKSVIQRNIDNGNYKP